MYTCTPYNAQEEVGKTRSNSLMGYLSHAQIGFDECFEDDSIQVTVRSENSFSPDSEYN